MYALGVLGIRRLHFQNDQDRSLFKTATFLLVSKSEDTCCVMLTLIVQLNNLGWSIILVHIIVRDLRDKKGVAPLFRYIGWALFRKPYPLLSHAKGTTYTGFAQSARHSYHLCSV